MFAEEDTKHTSLLLNLTSYGYSLSEIIAAGLAINGSDYASASSNTGAIGNVTSGNGYFKSTFSSGQSALSKGKNSYAHSEPNTSFSVIHSSNNSISVRNSAPQSPFFRSSIGSPPSNATTTALNSSVAVRINATAMTDASPGASPLAETTQNTHLSTTPSVSEIIRRNNIYERFRWVLMVSIIVLIRYLFLHT